MVSHEAKARLFRVFFDRKGKSYGLESFRHREPFRLSADVSERSREDARPDCSAQRADRRRRRPQPQLVRARPRAGQHQGGIQMTHSIKLLAALAATVLVAATAAAVALAGGNAGTKGTVVKVANSPLGRILVDSKGITLYDFPPDKGTTSVCYGACAALWPPLTTDAKPIAGPGIRASLLGTTKRSDGKLEVTYGGHPLYYFVSDRKPGQTTGQGVNQFGGPWWVLSAAGKEIHHV
jgi:predicted lipoprotein with Yx(FWY)xxD motif